MMVSNSRSPQLFRQKAGLCIVTKAPLGFTLSKNYIRFFSVVNVHKNEEAAANFAASTMGSEAPTIFDKILSKEIPSSVVYEGLARVLYLCNEHFTNKQLTLTPVLAFRDINPQAPVHIILIPKLRDGLTRLFKAEPKHKEILGHLMYVAKLVAEKEGLEEGYRVVIDDGPKGCQSIYHLHLHILGGRQLKWPPG